MTRGIGEPSSTAERPDLACPRCGGLVVEDTARDDEARFSCARFWRGAKTCWTFGRTEADCTPMTLFGGLS